MTGSSDHTHSGATDCPDRSARKPWQTPAIEDADVAALTAANGDSGQEGTPFQKPGS